ncbi:SseB family protein [Actinotalea solisilvae]|uniref:SseB family protein n=1 Tax=Actinotalea solisilvae TaxID=2072922 RepID=UPI0018F13499|nr:SseB family protein [Actinotalea solisilvae]
MPTFIPMTPFESALAAGQQSGDAAAVLAALPAADLVVPSGAPVGEEFEGFVPVLFDREGVTMLAVFTHVSRIGELADLAPYALTLSGADLLARVPAGSGVVLNPGQSVGMELLPDAVAQARRTLQG